MTVALGCREHRLLGRGKASRLLAVANGKDVNSIRVYELMTACST